MGWTQDFEIPGLASLYEQLTGEKLDIDQLIKDKFRSKGLAVQDEKLVLLDDGDMLAEAVCGKEYTIKTLDCNGFEVKRSTYTPKLVKRITEDGNHGIDVYEYKEKNEIVHDIIRESRNEQSE